MGYLLKQIWLECLQLKIIGSFVVWEDGDTILQLEGIRVGCIVDQDNFWKISIDDSEVFNVHAFLAETAVLTVETVLEDDLIGIDVVQYHVGIRTMAGCEDNELEMSVEIVEKCDCVWSDVDACFDRLALTHLYGEYYVGIGLGILIAVN